jgi:hypothetical protein
MTQEADPILVSITLFLIIFLSMAWINYYDTKSTIRGISEGGKEINPLTRKFHKYFGLRRGQWIKFTINFLAIFSVSLIAFIGNLGPYPVNVFLPGLSFFFVGYYYGLLERQIKEYKFKKKLKK